MKEGKKIPKGIDNIKKKKRKRFWGFGKIG